MWWYFPVTISIKTALGLIGLVLLAGYDMRPRPTGQGPDRSRALAYVLLVRVANLRTAGIDGLNLGVRHVLPLYAQAAIRTELPGAHRLLFRSKSSICQILHRVG